MRRNPFIETLEVPVHRVKKRDVPDWKENLSDNEYFEVEAISYTRLYRGHDKADKLKILLALSPGALRLLTWIEYYVPKDSDEIAIDDLLLSNILGLSGRHIQRMRLELVDAAILCRKKENVYWLNPRYICAGSRLKMYPANKRIVSKAIEDDYQPPSVMQSLIE
jgi:hypothetical protein